MEKLTSTQVKAKKEVEKKVKTLEKYLYFLWIFWVLAVIFILLFYLKEILTYKYLAIMFLSGFVVLYSIVFGWREFIKKKFFELLNFNKNGVRIFLPVGNNTALINDFLPVVLSFSTAFSIFLDLKNKSAHPSWERVIIGLTVIIIFFGLYFIAKALAARKYGKIEK